MVWKDNFIVGRMITDNRTGIGEFCNELMTFEGFMDDFLPLCFFKTTYDVFHVGLHLDEKHFPKTFLFANFQCLRCGLCCKNYECVYIEEEQIKEWEKEDRQDILKYAVIIRDSKGGIFAEIYPRGMTGCPLCRKVLGKPYYSCKINYVKNYVPVCKAYLCSKSIPVAHLNFKDIDELISWVGLEGYYSLIESEWGEEFDYSSCWIKTHKKTDLMRALVI